MRSFTGKKHTKAYKGFQLSKIPKFEEKFEVNMYIYTLRVIDGKVHILLIQNTLGLHGKSIHLGLVNDSDGCGSVFNLMENLTREV